MSDYDVIIVGGGVSGSIAAIAAARAGMRTLIVEKMGFLGGMLTAGGVGPMMTFHAAKQQVVQGLAEEVIRRMKEMGGTPGHIIDSTGYTYTVTPFDAECLKYVLETMFLTAGGKVLYHSMLSHVNLHNDRISEIVVTCKSGALKLRSTIFIDATGDADLAAHSGVPFQLGRPGDNLCQPVTMNFKVGNVDIRAIKEYVLSNPADCPHIKPELMAKAERLSMGGFCQTFNTGRATGAISFSRELILFFETNNPGEIIVNTTRIQKTDPTDSWQLSAAESTGRKQVWELFNLMRSKLPCFNNAVLLSSGPNIGVRESRKITGLYTLTTDDLFSEKHFSDEIACGGYPVDVHSPDGEGTQSRHLRYGAVYGIPYRSLLNAAVKNLITVGRCISATHEACAAIRVSPIAMAVGQAGGTAAALSVLQQIAPSELDCRELQNSIIANQGFLRNQEHFTANNRKGSA